MAINYYPKISEILICNFGSGFTPPEIVKNRPVIVLSSKTLARGRLATVVPISSVAPVPRRKYHILLSDESRPINGDHAESWVKCDMIMTVSFDRLRMAHRGHKPGGSRNYVNHYVSRADMTEIKKALKIVLKLE